MCRASVQEHIPATAGDSSLCSHPGCDTSGHQLQQYHAVRSMSCKVTMQYCITLIAYCFACRLIDFGSSKETSTPEQTVPLERMLGTLDFMSPEVCRCDHASPASDLWSAGVLLYIMLTGGMLPFARGKGDTSLAIRRRILR